MRVTQFFVQPWRLRRQLVAQQLLQQRFVLEPFIFRHIGFHFARGAARRLRLICARLWFHRRLTHSLHDAVKATGFRLLPWREVMETDVPPRSLRAGSQP